jgi:hypothetical protein
MKTYKYPTPCTSAFCGKIECPTDCGWKPNLDLWRMKKEQKEAGLLPDENVLDSYGRFVEAIK